MRPPPNFFLGNEEIIDGGLLIGAAEPASFAGSLDIAVVVVVVVDVCVTGGVEVSATTF